MTAITKTTAGLNLLAAARSGSVAVKVTYVAIGNGTAAPTAADTTLVNELARKATTTFTVGSTGEMLTTAVFGPSDANGVDVEEVAFYSGAATAAANSGTMVARGLYTHNTKLSSESLVFTLDEQFS